MKVMFFMSPEWGGHVPVLVVAKRLASLGHEVYFAETDDLSGRQLPDFRAFALRHGFHHVSLPVRPLNFNMGRQTIKFSQEQRLAARLEDAECQIRSSGIDVVLVDPILSYPSLAAARAGVAIVAVKTNLMGSMNLWRPPFNSSIVPDAKNMSRVTIGCEWLRSYAKVAFKDPLLIKMWLWLGPFSKYRKDAKDFKIHVELTEYGFRYKLEKQIVLCPRAFDFGSDPDIVYVGSVDAPRPEIEPADPEIAEARPLIYCSLGTNCDSYPELYAKSVAFFKSVIGAAAFCPEYDFLLQVGNSLSIDLLGDIPANVVVSHWVDQPEVLGRSYCAFTHGGLGTIKECIANRVPMVVFPVTFDQPGNAARVQYHGIGMISDVDSVSEGTILELVRAVAHRRRLLLANLDVMHKHVVDENELDDCINLILEAAPPLAAITGGASQAGD